VKRSCAFNGFISAFFAQTGLGFLVSTVILTDSMCVLLGLTRASNATCLHACSSFPGVGSTVVKFHFTNSKPGGKHIFY